MNGNAIDIAAKVFALMPPDVAAILRDEAQLRRARDLVQTELDKTQDHLHRLRRVGSLWRYLTRPSFRRERHRQRTQEAQRRTQLTSFLRQIKALQKRLAPTAPLRTAIGHALGEVEPTYRQGLRASRYHEHWRRHQILVRDRLHVLLKQLRIAHGCAKADEDQLRRARSRDTWHALEHVGAAALDLEQQVAALNHVGDAYFSMVIGTPFHEIRLPKLAHWDCVRWVQGIADLAPAGMVARLQELILECEHNRTSMLGTLDVLFRDAASQHSSIAEHHLSDTLDGVITHAERFWIEDRELHAMIEEIEARLTESERARWAQDLTQPNAGGGTTPVVRAEASREYPATP